MVVNLWIAERIELQPELVPEFTAAGVEAWIGRDPAWGSPETVAAGILCNVERAGLVSFLAMGILQWCETESLGVSGPIVEAILLQGVRWVAVWVPDDWTEGLSDEQAGAVREDLRSAELDAVVAHFGVWLHKMGMSR